MDILWVSAFTVGFLGSFHCAGMCGPIALALKGKDNGIGSFLLSRMAYNLGRIFTYSLMGMTAGFLGRSFSINGWQSDLSILCGVLILVFVLLTNEKVRNRISIKLSESTGTLKKVFNGLIKRKGAGALMLIGLLNGILPCGFVYLALAGAATTTGPLEGALFMALFGLGTLPMMLGIAITGAMVSLKARGFINRLSPLIAIALAVLLIHRGIMLQEEKHACCKKEISFSTGK